MEKPTLKQRADGILTFLWDSENGKVLGRGPRSWFEISLFYLVYYICLASFFAATIAVFYQTIDDDTPRLLKDSSLLNGNPGMGFRPMPDVEKAQIDAKAVLGKNEAYVKNLKEFLKPYRKSNLENTECDGLSERKGEAVSCKVNLVPLTNSGCDEANDYGMADGKPCVLLKLNKVYGWIPDMWESAGDSGLPDDIVAKYNPEIVPVKCYAKDDSNAADLGGVEYFPQQGFPIYYFPYEKQKDYRAPLVFAKFSNITQGKSFDIQCRVYAKNVEFDKTDNEGGTQFKVKVTP